MPVTDLVEFTIAVRVKLEVWATFVLGTDKVVVVEAGGVLPLAPPPQPIAKLSKQTPPKAKIGRVDRRLDGSRSKSNAARPVKRLSIHQDPGPNGSAVP